MFTEDARQRARLQLAVQDSQDNLLDFYAFVAYTSDCHGWEDLVIEPPEAAAPRRPALQAVAAG